jgi:hypothetical protein
MQDNLNVEQLWDVGVGNDGVSQSVLRANKVRPYEDNADCEAQAPTAPFSKGVSDEG